MSDTGRKDLTDKAGEAMKPDSQKSTIEKGQESASDMADKVSG